jgi:ankyrin repeat protein
MHAMAASNPKADAELKAALSSGSVVAIDRALHAGANLALLVDNPFLPGNQPIYPLMVSAIANGNAEVITALLEAGADPQACAANGVGCRQAALMTGNLALLEMLPDPQDPNAQAANTPNNPGPTPPQPKQDAREAHRRHPLRELSKPRPPWMEE